MRKKGNRRPKLITSILVMYICMKVIKFAADLVPLVQSGQKTSTWRLFDDKDLSEGNTVELWNKQTLQKFADAELLSVAEKTLGALTLDDHDGHNDGHNPYANDEEMYSSLQRYYAEEIGPDTPVKIIRFKLLQ
jgi:hypothetical protein